MSNPSDLPAVRGRHGIWHGSVEYEPSGHMDGGYLWGEPGLTWCGAHLVDPEYDNHEITCKRCLRYVDDGTAVGLELNELVEMGELGITQ